MANIPLIFGNEEKAEVNEITKKHKQKKTKKGGKKGTTEDGKGIRYQNALAKKDET